MNIHCTKRLAKRLQDHKTVHTEAQTETSPLGSWHANLYYADGYECVLYTNDKTRYSIFIPGMVESQFKHFDECFKGIFTATLFYQGLSKNEVKHAEFALGKIDYDTATNRSVMGTQNSLLRMIDARVSRSEHVMSMDIMDLSLFLNEVPTRGKDLDGVIFPEEEMKKLIASLQN